MHVTKLNVQKKTANEKVQTVHQSKNVKQNLAHLYSILAHTLKHQ